MATVPFTVTVLRLAAALSLVFEARAAPEMLVEFPVRFGPEALPATVGPSLPAVVVIGRVAAAGPAWFVAGNSTADSPASGRMLLWPAAWPEQRTVVSYVRLLIVLCHVQKFRCRFFDRGLGGHQRLLPRGQELHPYRKFPARSRGQVEVGEGATVLWRFLKRVTHSRWARHARAAKMYRQEDPVALPRSQAMPAKVCSIESLPAVRPLEIGRAHV